MLPQLSALALSLRVVVVGSPGLVPRGTELLAVSTHALHRCQVQEDVALRPQRKHELESTPEMFEPLGKQVFLLDGP